MSPNKEGMKIAMWLRVLLLLAVVNGSGCLLSAPVRAESIPLAVAASNNNLQRSSRGLYQYRVLSSGELRGWERFQLLVDGDGARTLMMWHDLAARDAQFTVVLRTDADFRPVEAYLNYYVKGGHKGSALIRVNGNELVLQSDGAGGPQNQRVEVPDLFSIGTHPVSGDGWHLWQGAARAGDQSANIFIMEASADLTKPLIGSFVTMPFQWLGSETLTTPAGRFQTEHYSFGGLSDVWLAGEDRLLVKMVNNRRDSEYLLVDYEVDE